MATQNFFARQIGLGTREDPYRPAGVDQLPAGTQWQGYSLAGGEWHIVRIEDAPVAVLNGYGDLVDVRIIPRDLTATVSNQGQVDAAAATLAELSLPSDWVQIGMEWGEILRVVWCLYSLYGRTIGQYYGQAFLDYLTPTNLDLAWQDHPEPVRQALRDAADSLGMDYSTVQASDPLKVALWKVAQNWGQLPWGQV